jgi:hypothetical protein
MISGRGHVPGLGLYRDPEASLKFLEELKLLAIRYK